MSSKTRGCLFRDCHSLSKYESDPLVIHGVAFIYHFSTMLHFSSSRHRNVCVTLIFYKTLKSQKKKKRLVSSNRRSVNNLIFFSPLQMTMNVQMPHNCVEKMLTVQIQWEVTSVHVPLDSDLVMAMQFL